MPKAIDNPNSSKQLQENYRKIVTYIKKHKRERAVAGNYIYYIRGLELMSTPGGQWNYPRYQ